MTIRSALVVSSGRVAHAAPRAGPGAKALLCLIAWLGTASLPGLASAATLQVDRSGQTAGAFSSIAAAVAVVNPGDTISLVPGSGPYREPLDIQTQGTASAPITFEGNGELITGFDPFAFSWNDSTAQWEYTLPPPIGNQPNGFPPGFRHLVTYQGQRLLISQVTGGFTSDAATLSADGLKLILGNASPDEGWEISTRTVVVRISNSNGSSEPVDWHHVYRNMRVSGARNDGFNLHGTGTYLHFENIEAFHNFDEGFSAHDAIHCSINGGKFWGNDNGLYNQSSPNIVLNANNIQAYANLGAGISMRQGTNKLTNSQAWDNGISNMALGGTFISRSNYSYESRWAEPPFAAYQETQTQEIDDDYPYTYDAYWKGNTPDLRHQAYEITGDEPTVLPASKLPAFALSYADWRHIYFSAGQLGSPAISNPEADADSDGRSNVQEYEDGTHPLVADSASVNVSVEVPDAQADSETGDPGLIVLRRSGGTASDLTVYFAMGGSAVADTDYEALNNYVEIPTGASTALLPVVPIADAEPNPPLLVILGLVDDATYVPGPASGSVELDSVELPIVSLSTLDASASEIEGETGIFEIRRSSVRIDEPLSVSLSISGTATPGEDYPAFAPIIEFPAGIGRITLDVVAVEDGLVEVNETVNLQLEKMNTYRLGNALGSITIAGEPLPTVMISASDANANESGDTGTFTVSRSSGGSALSVYFSINGTATQGIDYAPIGNSVLIPAGAGSADITISPIEDDLSESSESVVLVLDPDDNYVLGNPKNATVTISNYDPPTLTVTTIDPSASEAGDNTGVYSIRRNGPQTLPLMVQYTMSGSATAGDDYTALSGWLEIPIGASAATVTLSPLADNIIEGNETAILSLVASSEYVIGSAGSGTVTIKDVPPPTVALVVNDSVASEAADSPGQITISRTGSQTGTLIVSFSFSGTATLGTDYTDPGTSVEIPVGQSRTTVDIAPLPDALIEGSETVVLSLIAQAHYTLGATSAGTVNISDVAPSTLTLNVTDATASEVNGNTASFVISRSGDPSAPQNVNISTSGTAQSGVDYPAIPASLMIAAGEGSVSFSVQPTADAETEEPESILLNLEPGTDYLVGSPSTGELTIFDFAPPTVELIATDASASETPGDSGEITLTRTGSTEEALLVRLIISGSATPEQDYTALTDTVLIPEGASAIVIAVLPQADTLSEPDETVTLTLAEDAGYVAGPGNSATVSIANVTAPTISLITNDSSASESGNTGLFTIRRTGANSAPITIGYTVSGTASPGLDYTELGSEIVIPAGENAITLTVSPLPDDQAEGTETVVLTLAASSGYKLSTSNTGTVNIKDLPPPTVSMITNDSSAKESGNSGLFTIRRSGSTAEPLTVRYTLGGTASPDLDYVDLGNELLIAAGENSVAITVTPLPDDLLEETETVVLTLAPDPSYVLNANNSGTVNIQDAPPPTVSLITNDRSASESGNNGLFTIQRTGSNSEPLTVLFSVDGTASPDVDYLALGSEAEIPSGSNAVSLEVTPVADGVPEETETVNLTIVAGPGYLAESNATGTVDIKDVPLPTVTVTTIDSIASEVAGDDGAITLKRSGSRTFPLEVDLSVSGTATEGEDYAALATSAIIPAGEGTITIVISPEADAVQEDTETVILTVTEQAHYTLGSADTGIVSITDAEEELEES